MRFTADGDRAVAGSERLILRLDDLSRATNDNGGAHELNVNAPAQKIGRRTYVFASWSDGDPHASHAITTPACAATYAATFGK